MNKKALVVDDTRMVRDVFLKQLNVCGFDAQACASLEQTLGIIQNWQPDVVFLDLRMPDHDGFEVIEKIQSKFTDLPKVVAVTGMDVSGIRERTVSAGFDGFLLKPFSMTQLLASLQELLV